MGGMKLKVELIDLADSAVRFNLRVRLKLRVTMREFRSDNRIYFFMLKKNSSWSFKSFFTQNFYYIALVL